jgi:hypothetical protein
VKPKDENGPANNGDEEGEEVSPPMTEFIVSNGLIVAK